VLTEPEETKEMVLQRLLASKSQERTGYLYKCVRLAKVADILFI